MHHLSDYVIQICGLLASESSRGAPHTLKHLHCFQGCLSGYRIFAQKQFSESSNLSTFMKLPWKTPLQNSFFLLPYFLTPFLCNYLYRRDQQFTNHVITSTKLLRSFVEAHIRRVVKERELVPQMYSMRLISTVDN